MRFGERAAVTTDLFASRAYGANVGLGNEEVVLKSANRSLDGKRTAQRRIRWIAWLAATQVRSSTIDQHLLREELEGFVHEFAGLGARLVYGPAIVLQLGQWAFLNFPILS